MGNITLALCSVLLYSGMASAQVLFQDSTSAAGGPFHSGESWGASWGYLNDDLYPDVFSSNHGMRNGVLINNGDGTFSDVLDQVDLDNVWVPDPSADIHGGTWADFDNDGDQDLIVTRSSASSQVYLMKNNGLGQFIERGQQHGIHGYGGGRMPLVFDYTGDGNLDLSLARNGGGLEIFRWDPANNSFMIQTSETGITNQCLRNNYGLATDLFNTGSLHYLCMSESRIPERVYDTSTLPFTDVTNTVDQIGAVPDAVLADFNGDLLQDLVALRGRIRPSTVERVSSNRIEAWLSVGGTVNYEKSFTFKANGPITIDVYARVVGEPSGIKIGASGYNPSNLPFTLDPANSANWGTVSNHDQYSVFVGYDEIDQQWTVYLSGGGKGAGEGAYFTVSGNGLTEPTATGMQRTDGPLPPRFLLNNGSRLVDSGGRGIAAVNCGGITAADFDNDMDIDLYLACRTGTANIANRLYLNNGTGTFSLASGTHGAEGLVGAGIDGLMGSAEMAITADYDIDGFVDLFVTNGNRLFPHIIKDNFTAGGPVQFFRNLGNANHWLEFDLEGVTSNRDGFGAKIIVTAGGKSQVREQNGMYHRWSHDDRRLHFGLASNTTADVRVEWPDGSVDIHNNVVADKLYLATQNGALTELASENPTPTLSIHNDSVTEGDSVSLVVSLSPASASTVSVNYQTFAASATADADYVSESGVLTFNPNETSESILITTLQDLLIEGNESFTIELSNAVGADLGQAVSTVTILDDEVPVGPTISVDSVQVSESDANAVLTISLSEPLASSVSVDFETQDATATGGLDYEARSLSSMSFSPGQTSKKRYVRILQDTQTEGDETFLFQLSNAVGASLLVPTGVVDIIDDEVVVLPRLSVSNLNVAEDAGTANVVVTLSAIAVADVTVDLTTSNGSAIHPDDYTEIIALQATIIAGQTSVIVPITIVQDSVAEADETFTVTLSNPSANAELMMGGENATITISEAINDPTISVNSVQVSESDANAVLTISLSKAHTSSVSVDFKTQDDSAIGGLDYVARSLTTMSFSPGQTSKKRYVRILQDTQSEGVETFLFKLSNPVGASLLEPTGVVDIIDDDIVILP